MVTFTEDEQKLMNLFIDVALMEFIPKKVEVNIDTYIGEYVFTIRKHPEIFKIIKTNEYKIQNYIHEILFGNYKTTGPYTPINIPYYLTLNAYKGYKLFLKKQKNKYKKCPY